MTVKFKELKAYLDAGKKETRLIGALERHILLRPAEARSRTVLHPSDLVQDDWCALAAYNALRGNYVETSDKPGLRLQSIFDEGHAIHAKWQNYIAEMGNLYGVWGTKDNWALSKDIDGLEYLEVPLHSHKHRIYGHSDGWVKGLGEDFLIEIKSIGSGTIRSEGPALFAGGADLEAAWKNIRNPFRKHILQGQIYLHLANLMVEAGELESAPKEIVFIYELKANQDYKEFVVSYGPEFVEDIFEAALDVVWAVDNERPPVCNIDPELGCKRCAPFREGNNVGK